MSVQVSFLKRPRFLYKFCNGITDIPASSHFSLLYISSWQLHTIFTRISSTFSQKAIWRSHFHYGNWTNKNTLRLLINLLRSNGFWVWTKTTKLIMGLVTEHCQLKYCLRKISRLDSKSCCYGKIVFWIALSSY